MTISELVTDLCFSLFKEIVLSLIYNYYNLQYFAHATIPFHSIFSSLDALWKTKFVPTLLTI